MFRSVYRVCGIVGVLAASGCTPSRHQVTADSTAVADAVRLQFDSLTAAIRRVDVEGMLMFYADDSTLTRAIDGRLLRGRAVVERDFREGFRQVRRIDSLVIGNSQLRVLGPNAVVMTVPLREVFTDTTGARTSLHGTWTSVWARGAKGWRIVQDAAVHVPESPG
ncbi:MAG TPA: nuclear transport factor 2 family protein [Gemmatimonadaceae bacterium]|nr:nuclear transport factor 2 family protein [Gemmatimonadaceae bacterium]